MPIQRISDPATPLNDKIIASLEITAGGMAVVFIVLIVLYFLVSLLKIIDERWLSEKKASSSSDNSGNVNTPASTKKSNSQEIDSKTIAVISAAVATYISASNSKEIVLPGVLDKKSSWNIDSIMSNQNVGSKQVN